MNMPRLRLSCLWPILGSCIPLFLGVTYSHAGAVTGKIVINGQVISNGGTGSISQGSGQTRTEERSVKPFKQIIINTAVDMKFTAGQDSSLTLSGDDNLLSLIETTVHQGVLTISSKRSFSTHNPITVMASGPVIEKVKITASSDVQLYSLNSKTLDLEMTGSGDLIAQGSVGKLKVTLHGSGDFDLKALQADKANVKLTGSGDIELTATDKLVVNITGAGDVTYYGNPATVKKNISGVGDITSAD